MISTIPYLRSLGYEVRAVIEEKAKWKPPKLPVPAKIVYQKLCNIPEVAAEISATIEDQRESTVFSFKSPVKPT